MALKKMRPAMVMKTFFGLKTSPGGIKETLSEFAQELHDLSPEDKRYLEDEAAKELGVEIDRIAP